MSQKKIKHKQNKSGSVWENVLIKWKKTKQNEILNEQETICGNRKGSKCALR